MALDPNIALGVKSLELPNPLVQYGQLAQIQNAQNQNQLAQYQLGSAQREQESVNALNQAYAKAYDQKTGQINADVLRQSLASGGFGSKLPAVEKGLLELGKLKTETQKADVDLVDAKLKQARSFLDTINPLDPRAPEQYIAWHQSNHADPVLGPVLKARGSTPEQSMARIQQAIQAGPQAFADLLNASKLGTEKFIELNKPVTFAQDTGAGGRLMTRAGLGGPATLVPGSEFTKGMTFADRNAAARLAFDKSKFEFEKANPTMSIQEDPSGLLAVNTRTGMATPVVYGPMGIQAAPASAPGASLMRQPPAALPGQRMPAIPGMASVLDQTGAPTAPAAMPMPSTTGERVPGQPVTAKKALPEAYAKQAMGVANTNDSLEKLLSTMKNFKSSDMLNPTRRAELGQAHATTLLFAKELFNLGVLNGGDERIVNSVINNPVDFSSTAVPIEAIRKQARDLQGVVDRTNKNLSTVYKIPLLKLERSTPSGASDAASVDTSNPLLAN